MARICYICGKGRQTGYNVSHSKQRTAKVWQPNLAKLSMEENGKKVTVMVCAKCRKAMSKPPRKKKAKN